MEFIQEKIFQVLEKMKQDYLISKKNKNVCYHWIDLSTPFASLFGISKVITASVKGLKIGAKTARIIKYNSIIKKKDKTISKIHRIFNF